MSIILKAKDITLGGILTALTLIILYLTTVLPINKLTLLTLASFMVPIAVIRSNIKTALLVYISSALLAFWLVSLNIALLYTCLFGIYGILKYFAEKIKRLPVEVFVKFIFFNILLLLSLVLMRFFLGPAIFETLLNFLEKLSFFNIHSKSLILLWLLPQVAFAIYDYALSLLIGYYQDYFH